jgi:hypothetical protein
VAMVDMATIATHEGVDARENRQGLSAVSG